MVEGCAQNTVINVNSFQRMNYLKTNLFLLIIIIIYNKDLEVNMRVRDSQACNSDSR